MRRYAPILAARGCGGDSHARLWLPRRELDLHVTRRTAEFDDADVHAEANPSDKRVLQEMVQPSSGAGAALRLV